MPNIAPLYPRIISHSKTERKASFHTFRDDNRFTGCLQYRMLGDMHLGLEHKTYRGVTQHGV